MIGTSVYVPKYQAHGTIIAITENMAFLRGPNIIVFLRDIAMLPEKILNAREEIKAKVTKTHGWYVGPNHIDNFKLVASREILNHFMNIVVTMENEELHWNDWWKDGFKDNRLSSHCPDHSGLLKLANEIAEEIYNERKGNVSPLPA